MKHLYTLVCAGLLLLSMPNQAAAQDDYATGDAVSASNMGVYQMITGNIMKTAEMLDEDMYMYRPAETVRNAGQILAHLANAQYFFCSLASGEDNPNEMNYEEAATTKAEIVTALKSGVEYCAGVYAGMTPEKSAELRDFAGQKMATSAILTVNTAHNYEHYGNLVTYMRMNDLVPPSSQE